MPASRPPDVPKDASTGEAVYTESLKKSLKFSENDPQMSKSSTLVSQIKCLDKYKYAIIRRNSNIK